MKSTRTILILGTLFTAQTVAAAEFVRLLGASALLGFMSLSTLTSIAVHTTCPTAVVEVTNARGASSTFHAEGFRLTDGSATFKKMCPDSSVIVKGVKWRLGTCSAVDSLARIEADVRAHCSTGNLLSRPK